MMSSTVPQTCDWQVSRKYVKERGQYLLETGVWSDCRFIVGTEPNQQILEGHKLFLAMSSPVFEAMFFGGMAEKDPITILDVQPDAFKALLEYIYTDKINLTSFDQACELCYGAKKYMLPHLVEECTVYLWSDLSPKNACRAYEFAKLFEEAVLMTKCIRIICDQTQDILTETSFEDVEISTILMVFDQDDLSINSELDLFTAIQKYALRRNQHSGDGGTTGSKATIRDAIKKIRFLTLTPQEFAEYPGQSTLLTESEKFAILMNICFPSPGTPMPEGFSKSRVVRRKKSVDFHHESSPSAARGSLIKSNSVDNSYEPHFTFACHREILHTIEYVSESVLESAARFTCDKNICIYGIKVPCQVSSEQVNVKYAELLYAYLLDAEGSRLTYTHVTSRVDYNSMLDISFNRPIYIQKNKVYKVGVVMNKNGRYPLNTYPNQTYSSGVTFTFLQVYWGDMVRDGLIKAILFGL